MNKNLEVLKTVGKALGREQIVIAVKSFNIKTNKLEGHQVHLFSDKEKGITLYSNGVVLSGQYNPIKGQGSIKFVLNPKYKSPWVSTNNYIDANEIHMEVNTLIEHNPCIMEKHKAVNLLIAHYDDFITFCLENKYMQLKQLNHLSTQLKYRDIFNEKREVAAAMNEMTLTTDDKIQTLKNREPGFKYITFIPGSYSIEDCYGNVEKTCSNIGNVELPAGKLKDIEVEWTEKYFAKRILSQVDKNVYVIVYSTEGVFPNDRTTIKK